MKYAEKWNAATHLAGTVGALIGSWFLMEQALDQKDPWKILSFLVYSISLFSLYLSSTGFHSFSGRLRKLFRALDHKAVFLLIAGTYTPLTLVTLRDAGGPGLFVLVWSIAVFAMVMDDLPLRENGKIRVGLSLAMGWLILILGRSLFSLMPLRGIFWLVAGGFFYSAGVPFYVFEKVNPFFHGIWHIFVLAGSLSHFITVYFYILQ